MLVFPSLLLFALLPAQGEVVAKFPLGKDTTYVMGPLDKEGYIDYASALNERLGKGITAESNANVLIWRAIGPKPEGAALGMPAEYFERLGMEEPAKGDGNFISLRAYHYRVIQGDTDQSFKDDQARVSQRPWKPGDLPYMFNWLSLNERALALAVE